MEAAWGASIPYRGPACWRWRVVYVRGPEGHTIEFFGRPAAAKRNRRAPSAELGTLLGRPTVLHVVTQIQKLPKSLEMAERTAIPGSIGRIAEALRPEDRCGCATSCTLRTQCLFPAVEDQQDEKRRSSGTSPGWYQGKRKRQEMSKTSRCLKTTVGCSSTCLGANPVA